MNKIKSLLLLYFLLSIHVNTVHAQKDNHLSKKEIDKMIKRASDSLKYYYVNLRMGKKIGAHLRKRNKEGAFDNISHLDSLARFMTKELRSVNGDLHLYALHRPIDRKSTNNAKIEKRKSLNYGLTELKVLKGNIGYLRVKSFSNWDYYHETREMITNAYKFLEDSDAIIFDVRNNGGGVPQLVAFMISYLYPSERVHLAQYTHRYSNGGYGLYTEELIPGKRLPDVPVFVLVNNKSASAAEEFAYFLKHRKRATIIGKTTMGAGYGTMWHRLNDDFIISISSEEDINPITKTNFEKVGVIPNIIVEEEDILPTSIELAKKAAKYYKEVKEKRKNELKNKLKDINSKTELSKVASIIKKCKEETIINLDEINRLGYKFLETAPKTSEVIFKINVELYPTFSNVYDSYGDSLMANKKYEDAVKNYQKAIELGKKEKSRYLSTYQENLKKAKKKL